MKMVGGFLVTIIGLPSFISSPEVLAAQTIGPVEITKVRTGWATEQFAIETSQAIVNPANCAFPDGYASESSNPGYKTHYAAALTAFALGKKVTVVISDTECAGHQRPKIWGINIAR